MSHQNEYDKPDRSLAFLADLAKAFDVHGRTILRAVTGNPTEYWVPSHNPRLRIKDICDTFSVPKAAVIALLTGREEVFSPTETAELLGISVRTLRNRQYTPLVTGAGFLRFAKSDIDKWYAANEFARREKINKLF
jgi:hypothetical protein